MRAKSKNICKWKARLELNAKIETRTKNGCCDKSGRGRYVRVGLMFAQREDIGGEVWVPHARLFVAHRLALSL